MFSPELQEQNLPGVTLYKLSDLLTLFRIVWRKKVRHTLTTLWVYMDIQRGASNECTFCFMNCIFFCLNSRYPYVKFQLLFFCKEHRKHFHHLIP